MTSIQGAVSEPSRAPSDGELEAMYLTACSDNIQWLIDTNRTDGNQLTITGWAITLAGQPERARFLLDGVPFEEAHYPLASPDIGAIFWNLPNAA